jgi:hypothetical protein
VVVLNVTALDHSFVTRIFPFYIQTKEGEAAHFLSSAVYVLVGPTLHAAESLQSRYRAS